MAEEMATTITNSSRPKQIHRKVGITGSTGVIMASTSQSGKSLLYVGTCND